MTTIVTRAGKGSPLTNTEMDTNLTNLNSYKVEQDISGNATITGDVYLTGSGKRITGDFSNATVADRVMFQTSTVNGNTNIHAIANGTGSVSSVQANNSSDPANGSQIYIAAGASITQLVSDKTGTGTYLPMAFYTGGYERGRFDTSGNLLVGTQSTLDNSKLIVSQSGDKTGIAVSTNSTGGSSAILVQAAQNNATTMTMLTNGGANVAGVIYCSGSTTSYSTSSDYRLKTNVQPIQNALARIAQLKPCSYTWKSDGAAGEGFIAHELQAVVPQCVTGKKDEVDACGNPVYQGVDTSFLVATLVKAIQELKSDFDAYKATHP